jgi:beta-lactamase class A
MLAPPPDSPDSRQGLSDSRSEPSDSRPDERQTEDAPENLETQLRRIAKEHPGTYGAVVYDPESEQTTTLNADEPFVAASLGKLPPLITLYRAAARGELDLDEPISILPTDIQTYGSGVLSAYPVGHTITLRECAWYLIQESDNTAWVMLERRLGFDEIAAELDRMGADGTNYYSRVTTPRDVLLMLRSIADPRFTTPKLSGEMLDDMTDTSFEDRIPAALPEDVRVAHKIGSYGDTFGDAGIVFYKDEKGKEKSYFIVVIAKGATEEEARSGIRDMAHAVHKSLSTPKED